MPFKKVGKDNYVTPSGRHYNQKQVNLYYATDGFRKQVSTSPISRNRHKKSATKKKRG